MKNKKYILPPEQEDDPFVRDALEGWAQFPNAKNKWWRKNLQFKLFLISKSWKALPSAGKLAIGTLSSVAIIAVAAISIPFNFNNSNQNIVQQDNKTSTESQKSILTDTAYQQEKSPADIDNGTNPKQDLITTEDENSLIALNRIADKQGFKNESINDREAFESLQDCDEVFQAPTVISSRELNDIQIEETALISDALPYIWVEQYRILDYDALNNNLAEKYPSSISKSLDSRFSNHSERKKIEKTVVIDTVPYNYFVKNAIMKLKSENYSDAEYDFKKLLVQKPNDENAIFYLGYSLYKQGNYSQALVYFEKTQKTTYKAFASDANWYMANIYLNLGNRNEALDLLKTIVQKNGTYKNEAKKLIEREFHD